MQRFSCLEWRCCPSDHLETSTSKDFEHGHPHWIQHRIDVRIDFAFTHRTWLSMIRDIYRSNNRVGTALKTSFLNPTLQEIWGSGHLCVWCGVQRRHW